MNKNAYSHSDCTYVAKVFENDAKGTPSFKNKPFVFKGNKEASSNLVKKEESS